MLTHDRLLELYRALADRPVLSIYVDGNQHDPAERKKWRIELERSSDRLFRRLRRNG